ncbi:MAG: SDR family NAD(P)-dependent oxidoreductase [Tannerellaceae bacterium]|jgi:NAD(P)-dependent dehydrogenase (short-subunit alcohol dehydrogenase family)|nr:SDR family NAD(P)-dependent oxidoreductase [Tannerellaceae bacterium]
MKVRNKVIMITGGGNGLGRETALNLLGRGAKVVAVDINEAALEETEKLAGEMMDRMCTFNIDITDEWAVDELPGRILGRFGAIDGVINNAGIIQPFRRVNNIERKVIERVFRINFFGTLNVLKAFLPYLLDRPEAHVVNISSMGGFLPVAGQSIYGASKAAVKILSEGLASELSKTRVGVTTAFPGAMFTDIKANSGLGADAGAGPEGHSKDTALSPAKAAGILVDAIEHNTPRLYIGKDARMMNILYRLSPAFATDMIYRKISHKM